MKRIALLSSLLIAGAAVPVAAQTRVAISIGVNAPRPYASGLVVVGRPHRHYRYHYHHRHRAYHRRAPVVVWRPGVVIVAPRGGVYHRRHYHRW